MRVLNSKLLLCLILGLLLLSGCEFQDIDKRYFVISIGIDQVPDKDQLLSVSLKLAIPSPNSKEKQDQFEVRTAQSRTLSEAIAKIKATVSMELEFGQVKTILFGEKLAHNDLLPTTNWLVRNQAIQKIALLGIASPSAEALLQVHSKAARLPAYDLYLTLSKSGTRSNYITNVMLFDLYRKTFEKGWSPVLPVITLKEEGYEINRTAVLSKSNTLHTKLLLNPNATEIHNMVTTNLPHLFFHVQREDMSFSVDILNVTCIPSVHTVNGKTDLLMSITGKGIITESKNPLLITELRRYEQLAEAVVQERIEAYLKLLQQSNVDPVGFGLHYRSSNWPDRINWEKWTETYPNMPTAVKVKLQLKNTGLIH